MPRRIEVHRRRRVHSLDGLWSFAWLGDLELSTVDPTSLRFDDVMAVPGCFDATPRYAGLRGLAAYRTTARLTRAGLARLSFEAVHHYCRTFVGGREVGEHHSGFTAFAHDLGELPAGEVEIVVLVDNRFDAQQSPLHLDYSDWYHYGGISRSVALHELPSVYIEDVEVETKSLEGPELLVRCLFQSTEDDLRPTFQVYFNGALVSHRELVLDDAGAGVVEETLLLPGAQPWTPDAPRLHEVRVCLGEDDFATRVGLRTIEARDRQLWLNGEKLQLRGINRHEAHPAFGHAVPPQQQLADLQLVRRLGANFLRGSHYPQDRALLDLCDEQGILVLCEAIGWQQTEAQLQQESFVAAELAHVDEMLSMAYNHPSVILWGILNEADSTREGCRPAFQRLVDRIRERDPGRPVTYSSLHGNSDLMLDLIDVVSVNTYPGWYHGSLDAIPSLLSETLASYRAKAEDKPILVTEVGAGAIYGTHDHQEGRWSEEYQANLVARVAAHLLERSTDCVGVCFWQLCDTRSTERTETALARPRGFNNKGLLDEYRRPKLAFEALRRHFLAARSEGSPTSNR